jgi:hypothetical protein
VIAAQRLRAPRDHGAILAVPSLDEVGRLLTLNRQRLNRPDITFLGRSWPDLQVQARREVLAAARSYMGDAGDRQANSAPIIMAGHQPDLFHPGVWAKNFALHGLARRHGCVAVNLVVDNDAVKSVGLNVPLVRIPLPAVAESAPRLTNIPFDRLAPDAPYEEYTIRDESVFADLPDRVPTEWGFEPLLKKYWATVRRQSQSTNLLGERFAAARREWEQRWACRNLEVPVSRLSRTDAFGIFACHILSDLPQFHAVHNACTDAYRRAHGIRSRNHPVPDLTRDGDWLETPFWAWRAGTTRRRRLMARCSAERIELRMGDEIIRTQHSVLSTPYPASGWQTLEKSGVKVRPRALTNTLFARLFLCDLFIHGIGGAKYDELTDEIMRRFYGVEPPEYLVLTATLLLPFHHYPSEADSCRRLAYAQRDLHWNPQRHVSLDSPAAKLVFQKNAWINQQPDTRKQRRERFRMLRELSEHLRGYTGEYEMEVSRERERCEREVRANEVLQRRDYSFCLYPEEMLREFYKRFLSL